MKEAEMIDDIKFLLDQLNLIEWAQDDYGIKRVEEKYQGFYEGRARRDNMTCVGDLEYDT